MMVAIAKMRYLEIISGFSKGSLGCHAVASRSHISTLGRPRKKTTGNKATKKKTENKNYVLLSILYGSLTGFAAAMTKIRRFGT